MPAHEPDALVSRQLARDKTDGRIGEIMPTPIPADLCEPSRRRRVSLRPVGGGCEWPVRPEDLELIEPSGGES